MPNNYDPISDYISSAIPDIISKKRKAALLAELECHILDKSEYYTDIGYDKDKSLEKAIEEMGNGDEIRKKFEDIYCESRFKWLIVTVIIMLTASFGFVNGFSSLSEILYRIHNDNNYENIIISTAALCCVLILILTSARKKQRRTMKALAFIHLFMALTPAIFGCLYEPFVWAFLGSLNGFACSVGILRIDNICPDIYITILLSELLKILICTVCFRFSSSKKIKTEKQKNLKASAVISISVLVLTIGIVTDVSYTYFNNRFGIGGGFEYLYKISDKIETKAYEEMYSRLSNKMTFEEADDILKSNGYICQSDFKKYMYEEDYLYYTDHYIVNDKTTSCTDILYIKSHKDGFASIYSPIISISYDGENNNLTSKSLGYNIRYNDPPPDWIISDLTKINSSDPNTSYSILQNLNIGEKKNDVIKKFRKYATITFKKTDYSLNGTQETYTLNSNIYTGDIFYTRYTQLAVDLIFIDGEYVKNDNLIYDAYDEEYNK